jgi:hypothetical protein
LRTVDGLGQGRQGATEVSQLVRDQLRHVYPQDDCVAGLRDVVLRLGTTEQHVAGLVIS